MAGVPQTGESRDARVEGRGRRPYLETRHVFKNYGAVRALNDVNAEFQLGEIHALVGENGAGKTTLKKVLSGEDRLTSGEILIDGSPVRLGHPMDARAHGIAVVHQHFPLVLAQTAAENIYLGAPPVKGMSWLPLLDRATMLSDARAALDTFGLAHLAHRRVRELSVAERQVVSITTALKRKVSILILDEPTSSLSGSEVRTLFDNMQRIRDSGACVIFISHSMEEVLAIADRITVLRDGWKIDTVEAASENAGSLIRMIVGRDLANAYPKKAVTLGEPILQAQGVETGAHGARSISFTVRSGEILGFPAQMGSGIDGLLRGVSGRRRFRAGSLEFAGSNLARSGLQKTIRAGLCLVPGDATVEGLIPKLSIEDNVLLANQAAYTRYGIIRRQALRGLCRELIRLLDIRPPDPSVAVENLSGGNRQKVVIGKWLAAGARLLVMDDPTKGVDVGAKMEIYSVIGSIIERGSAVILASSDLDELMGLADRIIVVRDGEAVGEVTHGSYDKVRLLELLVGSLPTQMQGVNQGSETQAT